MGGASDPRRREKPTGPVDLEEEEEADDAAETDETTILAMALERLVLRSVVWQWQVADGTRIPG